MARSVYPHANSGIGLDRERRLLKRLIGKVAASVADQGIASSTNFLLNVLLARWLLPVEYGAYSVCWSILLVLAAFHNALILEPMAVIGPSEYGSNLNSYLRTTRRLNWFVVFALAGVALVVGLFYRQQTVRTSLFILSACLPGYLLLLVARRKQYVLNQPIRALLLSLAYSLLTFIFLYVCRVRGQLSALTAVAAFGLTWFVALSVRQSRDGKLVPSRQVAREHWRYGKWLFASAILAIGISDMQTILLSMLVDLKAAGALRALMNFVLPLSQLLTVLSVYALPRLSGRAKQQGTTRLLKQAIFFPAALIGVSALYLLAITLFARPLEHLLYGGKMLIYLSWMPLLAGSAFASAVGASFSTLLRAVQNSQHQFFAGITGTAVGLACAFTLLRSYGVLGALWSMLAANSASTLVILATYSWLLRRRNHA